MSLKGHLVLWGEHTIGIAPGFLSNWTTTFLIVPTPSNINLGVKEELVVTLSFCHHIPVYFQLELMSWSQ